MPVGDRKDYDCVVEKDGVLKKVQVKYAGKYADGVCRVGLRITGGNQSRNYTKKYVDDAFDLLFIYTEKGTLFEIPWKHFPYKNELTIEDKKYIKYRLI